MQEQQSSMETIADIKKMMERSSRFISLSGLSGISAGVCALIGAWLAHPYVYGYKNLFIGTASENGSYAATLLNTWIFWIAMGTLVAAILSAFVFTYIKSKKDGTPIWGTTARRLILNVLIPVAVGGIFLLSMMQYGTFGLVAPGCLLFYGLALINASKYSLAELRYLGYCQIILGIINLNFAGYGLYFWAAGFGLLHIGYGAYMWYKYERIK